MKNYINRIIGIILLIGSTFSCSSDLDFDQANDLKLQPTVVGNFSYFNIAAADFVGDDGSQRNIQFDNQEFDVFRDRNLNSYLQKADFHFEITNTINRAYTLMVLLQDENNQTLDSILFTIPAYTGSNNTITRTEVFENQRLELLKRARKMEFLIAMSPGPALNKNSTGNLILRSSATVYLEIQ
ncbi:hypothetical protein [Flavobacterium seoulense]|uniref:DUF4843 domain-containing protein n=1 Tax=Flavobacterium seoulense TaxID=1492738 RepID=A0A066WYZ0_9FLAO|nr:hypothetical protein [Flavobacterium seoulense]KDN56154.1 hypothetical protein FEM21_07060 [Flavobacterium seoulense]